MSKPRQAFSPKNFDERRRELIAFTDWLNREYAQLMETSAVLRQESKELSKESQVLRRAGSELALQRSSETTRISSETTFEWSNVASPEHHEA